MRTIAKILTLATVVTITGCATGPKTARPDGFFHVFADCREEYKALEAKVEKADVRNPVYYTVPGFPYFRTNRLHASFADELDTPEKLGGWMRRMREFDQEAREFEYMNMGMTIRERGGNRHRMLGCGQTLAALEAELPGNLELIKANAQPPKGKSGLAGMFGLGGASESEIKAHHERWQQQLNKPVSELEAQGALSVLKVKPTKDPAFLEDRFKKTLPDELGFPGLIESAWLALAERHAPILWLETASERDIPGEPVWTAEGITVDPAKPRLYYNVGFTRFGSVPAVQISYFGWFRGVNGDARIDGTVWRVTLDLNMDPIAYESVRASGDDHLWFPVMSLERNTNGEDGSLLDSEAFVAKLRAPSLGVAVRLDAGSHSLKRVVSEIETQGEESGEYQLERFEDLYFLPTPDGSSRNLFEPDGTVADSDPEAPARHFSRMPVDLGKAKFFDDPFLMQSVFRPFANPVKLHNPFAPDA